MEYNFSPIQMDTIAGIEKKLDKAKKDMMSEIANFFTMLNNEDLNQKARDIFTEIGDIFNDEAMKANIIMTGAMNKINNVLVNRVCGVY